MYINQAGEGDKGIGIGDGSNLSEGCLHYKIYLGGCILVATMISIVVNWGTCLRMRT